jgi:hypothetical protein
VGTFSNLSTSYTGLTTNAFTVAAGDHTIAFQGLDPDGGDDTAFIDAVQINSSTATAPAISNQPTSQTVTAGQSATFSVTADGTGPLSYQWQKLVNGTWTDISGATSSTFTISSTQAADAGQYEVIVSNSAGGVTSNTVSLTVDAVTGSTALTTGVAYDGGLSSNTTWAGATIKVGSSNLTVTALGRMMLAGNSGTHTLILAGPTGQAITSVTVSMAGGVVGQFHYATLSNPVVLLANKTYYLVSQETSGGDQYAWGSVVTTTSAAMVTGAAGGSPSTGFGLAFAIPGVEYGPVDLKYAPFQLLAGTPLAHSSAPRLTLAQLTPVEGQAIAAWEATGALNASQDAALHHVQFVIANLPGPILGETIGSEVIIDANAAGYGWSVASQVAPNNVDLLTVVEHELGHVMGLPDIDPQAHPGDLMDVTLPVGVRRSPSAYDISLLQGLPDADTVGYLAGGLSHRSNR